MPADSSRLNANASLRVRSPIVRRALERAGVVFDRLDAYSYLKALDRGDFSYYRDLYEAALLEMDDRIDSGRLVPVDLRDFPDAVRFPRYEIKAAIFIGSFDPFQMTHLAMALRYLSSPDAAASVVFVVPEGCDNPDKPFKSDYAYRFNVLSMQLADVFDPLIVPLDIGQGADTIEIVRRFIAMFPGSALSLTHILGTDALPHAVRLLPEDMAVWHSEAALQNVRFDYEAFVMSREDALDPAPYVESIRAMGHAVRVDPRVISTPSSTDFRDNRMFSIVFPTESVIRHMEVLFRYNLNRPWRVEGSLCESEQNGSEIR